jgi:hypothetical protein
MGGVAGHLSHLHENLDFTFGEIKSILSNVAQANIESVEKVDGQNVFFTWHAGTGSLHTARNPGDITKGGMSPEEYASKWKGHPAESAFMNGFKAIKRAIDNLDEGTLLDIFGANGDNWVNSEIMYHGNPNIINYGGDWVVLHNMQSFGESGEASMNTGAFGSLVSAVQSAEDEIDEEGFRISGPQLVELQDLSEGLAYEDFVADLDGATGMTDGATIREYVEEALRTGPIGSVPLPVHQQEDLIKIILDMEGAPAYADFKKSVPKEHHKLVSTLATKTNKKKIIAKMVLPVETAISNFAIEVLRGLKSFFIGDHDAEVERMRKEVEDSIAELESAQGADAEKLAAMLEKQATKLGPIENIASTMEGIVFEHPPGSQQLYKLTGTFAMANQLIGRARGNKAKREKEAEESVDEAVLRKYVRSWIGVMG